MQLNCASTVHFAKHIAEQMVARGEGKILFTASIAGEMTAPREAVYAASKAFVLHLAKALHFELKEQGVTVTALQPGPTDTDFFNRAHLGNTDAGTEGKKQSEPYDVAVQGLDALFDGKENVYAAATLLKVEGALMGLIPTAFRQPCTTRWQSRSNHSYYLGGYSRKQVQRPICRDALGNIHI